MAMITREVSQQQKKSFFQLFVLMLAIVLISWVCGLFLIEIVLRPLTINLNSNYFWLAFAPMLLILSGFVLNRPIAFDWMGLYAFCIPFSLLYLVFSVLSSFAYLPKPFNIYVSLWMLVSFIVTLFFRASMINYKSIKKNLLKYNIDKAKAFYAPQLNNADVGKLYKKNKNDNWLGKLKVLVSFVIIYAGPVLIGINISSAGRGDLKVLGLAILLYLVSMIGGIYMLLLYYARLKCLYQIQKELGCKLRFS